MGYIILIIVVVAIVIIAFVFGTNGKKNGKRTYLPRSIRGLINMDKDGVDVMIKNIERHKSNVLDAIVEEINKQNQLSGTSTHLAEDIRGVTEYTIQKKLDLSERLTRLCLEELERENKIRRMKLSGDIRHYVPA